MDQEERLATRVQSRGEARTHLHGKPLVLVRTFWVVLVLLTLGVFAIGFPSYAASLHILCNPGSCNDDQLSFLGLSRLQAWGLSLDFYVAFVLIRLSVFVGGYLLVSLVLFWRKSDDWMVLLTSFALIAFAAIGFDTPLVGRLPAGWMWPAQGIQFLDDVCFTLFFYLFPDGQFVPHWTRWFISGVVVFWGSVSFFSDAPFNPLTRFPILGILLLFVVVGSAVLAQVYRYRRVSAQVQRQQTKWVVYGMTVAFVGFLVLLVLFTLLFPLQPFSELVPYTVTYLLLLLIPLSISFAILRYRLWDIDILMNRTLVYGTLTASIVGIYVFVVGYFSLAFQVSGSPVVSMLATGLIAVLFQPLRNWLQQLVNRLMYGERDEPYKVISRLGGRLETTLAPDMVLPTIVETVTKALKLPYAAICLKQDGENVMAISSGQAAGKLTRLPLVYQSEQIGDLLLAPRTPGETFSEADRALLADLARQAGIAVHAIRLTTDLRHLTKELQHARQSLVTAREEERRRLRRDLHDGLGPTLGAFTVTVGSVRYLYSRDPVTADALLEKLERDIATAVTEIRHLAYALRPPALDDLGLVDAIEAYAAQYTAANDESSGTTSARSLTVALDAPTSLPALPAAVEVAAYRIAQEALTNVVRYAQARTCTIRIAISGLLELEIKDDGVGLPANRHAGVGLLSMCERAEELGGTCEIDSEPGKGTRVVARLPLGEDGAFDAPLVGMDLLSKRYWQKERRHAADE